MKKLLAFPILLISTAFSSISQNEVSKWYFSSGAALDFMTEPPSTLAISSMSTNWGSSSISDAAGNLLFYTNGVTIWNKQHVPMANGTGLLGIGAIQQALIVKQPGNNNNYYVFTVDYAGPDGARYSVVDMNLAAGMGSVTVKNILMYNSCVEMQAAAPHANGTDKWIISHKYGNNDFYAYLLTGSGLGSSPVISSEGPMQVGYTHCSMKYSLLNRRLGTVSSAPKYVCLFDFNPQTGAVANAVTLDTIEQIDCEFSPDGSKFYACAPSGNSNKIWQWDLCSGTDSAVIASKTLIGNYPMGRLQLAINGKIYCVSSGIDSLSVIHEPNKAGTGCNYTHESQPSSGLLSGGSIPNFERTYFAGSKGVFSYTINNASCGTASFSAPCFSSLTYTSVTWHFGDPASGTNNTAAGPVVTHTFTSPGTYKVKMALQLASGGADTLFQIIPYPFSAPGLSVAGNTSACKGDKLTLTASGAVSYTWTGSAAGATVAVTPSATTVYTVTGADASQCTAKKTHTVSVAPCAGVADEPLAESEIVFYPNPASGRVIAETYRRMDLRIYNVLGDLAGEYRLEAGRTDIDLSGNTNGIYLFVFMDKETVKTKKVLLQD